MFTVRSYKTPDYLQVAALYKQSDLYGGQFDQNRDSKEKLARLITKDPDAILVCESRGKVFGTISLIEDGRVALLFRFAVQKGESEHEIVIALYDKALEILRNRGHQQVLVYAPVGNKDFYNRYSELGFEQGGSYTCFWKDI